jgi:hypothetical protein
MQPPPEMQRHAAANLAEIRNGRKGYGGDMSEHEGNEEVEAPESPEEPRTGPGPGSPVGDTIGEGSERGQLEDTPTISDDEQVESQTQHAAPEDDVGVPQDQDRE